MSEPNLYIGELAAMSTAVLWTLSALVWTATGKKVGALAASFIRVILTCLLLMVYQQIARGRPLPTDLPVNAWLLLSASGFFWYFVSDLCLFKAFLLIGPRLSLLITSLTPPIAATLSWVCIGDELALWHWIAMAVTLAGVAWVVSEQPNGDVHPHTHRDRTKGIILALVAAAAQAIGLVLSKQGVGECDPMAATLICMLGALSGFVVLVTFRRRWPATLAATRHYRTMAILVVGVVIGPILGVACNLIALGNAPAGVVATIIATMPVLIFPFSIALHHEKASLRAIVGAILAVVGVAMLVL